MSCANGSENGSSLMNVELWKAPVAQPHFHTLPAHAPNILKLVPGGRWLLVGYRHNRICYHDLDSKDFKQMPLIEPTKAMRGGFQDVDALGIYLDQDALILQFKIAISGIVEDRNHAWALELTHDLYPFPEPLSPLEVRWLHIWQVRLEGGNSLVAEWVASIPIYFHGAGRRTLAIEQHLLARTVTLQPSLSWVEVHRWRQCSSTRVLRAVFPIAGVPDRIYVIGGRVLCIKPPATVELYDFPQPEYLDLEEVLQLCEDSYPEDEEIKPREPLLSHSFSSNGTLYSSPLYYDGTAHRLVVSTNQGIWGLVFPVTEDGTPDIIQLSTFSNRGRVCMPGISNAFYGKEKVGVRIRYGWSGEHSTPLTSISNSELEDVLLLDGCAVLDEEGGRFVYVDGGNSNGITAVEFLD